MANSNCLNLIVRHATNLNLESQKHLSVASTLKSATFEVVAAFTDGAGYPVLPPVTSAASAAVRNHKLSLSRKWDTKTSSVKASPLSLRHKDGQKKKLGECSWSGVGATLRLKYNNDPGEQPSPDETRVTIALRRDYGSLKLSHEVGRTSLTLRELADMDQHGEEGMELMLFEEAGGELVAAGKEAAPTILRVSVDGATLPASVAGGGSSTGNRGPYAKQLMIVTRGTRGDIQPFVALSRGLAALRNWDVTIVTELGYKAKLKQATAGLGAGVVRFRPSGGDTMAKVSSQLSQTAINLKVCARQTDGMQKVFLSRSEVEFFGSEPAVHHWAARERPDFLMFGFTMATVTLVASEALGIPVMGFVLQPTSIPSAAYPPILPLREAALRKMVTDGDIAESHDEFKMLKYLMDNAGAGSCRRADLRRRRGLEEYKSYETSTWQELKDKDVPLIVPINETMFGGKPDDWSENSVFTDCIFLSGKVVPPVADDAIAFIDGARAACRKIVVLAFSSMPVSKTDICSIALKVIDGCESKVSVFALVGGQMDDPFPGRHADVERAVGAAVAAGTLFLAAGAPFGRLFKLADAVVLHGGLGTTSEALVAKLPTIVTGVLLLDQRFWGSRCREMGVGPFGVHVDDFPDVCVEYVDRALRENSAWKENAARIGALLLEQAGDDPSGVKKNVECVAKMSEVAKPYHYSRKEDASEAISKRGVAKKLLKLHLDSFKGHIKKKEEKSDKNEKDKLGLGEVYVEAV